MISPECQRAGQLNAAGDIEAAILEHKHCRGGTWCDCACATGPGHLIVPAVVPGSAGKLPEPPRPIQQPTHHFSTLTRAYELGRSDMRREIEHLTGYTVKTLGL